MPSITMDKKDEMIMRLVHYFITEQNYAPIVVNGVKDEIWLENHNGPYKIIRINANYIHNEEQMNFDLFKLRNVMHQVKHKTVSFTMNALNILLNVNDSIEIQESKNIDSVIVKNIKDINVPLLTETFPDIDNKLLTNENGLELIVNVTNDINKKTEKENKLYAKTFKDKKLVFTPIIIALNIIIFLVIYAISGANLSAMRLLNFGGVFAPYIQTGEVWRLVTGTFLHAGIIHLLVNMYSLYLIGLQIENFIGKYKFLAIYFISAITGSLMSCIIHPGIVSVGASGAIFGLLGSLVYFGYHYRLYLGSVLRNQIIPIILCNLLIGFMISGVDNAAHIGGLIGGYLATMAFGIEGKSQKKDSINGIITLSIYFIFLVYVVFFR